MFTYTEHYEGAGYEQEFNISLSTVYSIVY